MGDKMPPPHLILGVSPGASEQEVKEAYRRLSKQHHPDLCAPHLRPAAEQYFKEINLAYASLVRRGGPAAANVGADSHTAAAAAQAAWQQAGQYSKGPPKFSNGLVAAVIAAPLVLLGIWLQKKDALKTGSEWSARPYGFLHPPVNPFLREDLKPKVYSRFDGNSKAATSTE